VSPGVDSAAPPHATVRSYRVEQYVGESGDKSIFAARQSPSQTRISYRIIFVGSLQIADAHRYDLVESGCSRTHSARNFSFSFRSAGEKSGGCADLLPRLEARL